MILKVFSSLCNSMILCHVVGLLLRGMACVNSYSNDQFKTELVYYALKFSWRKTNVDSLDRLLLQLIFWVDSSKFLNNYI